MNIHQISMAHQVVMKLGKVPLCYKDAWELRKLRDKTRTAFDFLVEHEQLLIREHAAKDNAGAPIFNNGNVRFPNRNSCDAFIKGLREIREVEQDWEHEPIIIHLPDNVQISVEDIDCLDGFVVFMEEGEANG